MLVRFHIMGVAVNLHHAELGVVDETEATERDLSPEEKMKAADAELEEKFKAEIARGNLKGAEELAYEAMRSDPHSIRRNALYHQALMAQPDKAKAMAHAQRYLTLLMKTGNMADAVRLFKRCRAADPDFQPPQPQDILPLAQAARGMGDTQAAVDLVRGFDKRYAGNADIPAVYLFSAKLMFEDLRNADMAMKILAHLVAKYPGHSVAAEAGKMLKIVAGKPA